MGARGLKKAAGTARRRPLEDFEDFDKEDWRGPGERMDGHVNLGRPFRMGIVLYGSKSTNPSPLLAYLNATRVILHRGNVGIFSQFSNSESRAPTSTNTSVRQAMIVDNCSFPQRLVLCSPKIVEARVVCTWRHFLSSRME